MSQKELKNIPESDIAMSSRVRLARNLKDYPFPVKMDLKQGEQVLLMVKDAIFQGNASMADNFNFYDIRNLNQIEKQMLVEKHLISRELAETKKPGGAVIDKEENISVMVNEEDHLRIQGLFSGMQLEKAWDICNKIDNLLEEKIDFAFSDRLGYLTCCPTNLGTGIRASVMLHLPALTMTGYLKGILEACSKVGITVRGLYGENTEALGNMFQVSNQVTLGQSEEEIINNVKNIALQIIEQERILRKDLYKQNTLMFEDKVFRSLGILLSARVISSEESHKLLSDVRLGIDMGIIKHIGIDAVNEIIVLTQPANLQATAGKALNPVERDVGRANLIRSKLGRMDS